MLFNTVSYVIFLPIVVAIYFLLPQKFRWLLLLIASYFFYMCWKPEYLGLILASTVVDYLAALKMEKIEEPKKKKYLLWLSLTVNLGLLFFFKYHNFFAESVNSILTEVGFDFKIKSLDYLLPVGISFYTFQTLSYTIDVYKGRMKAEKHLGIFALYVSFFPQLVAGPIERFTRLAPQFRIKQKLTYDNIANGLRLILFGLFIKMVIADNISIYADKVFASPMLYQPFDVLTGLFLYTFQIYSDFFGYSIIAIGSALILGIKLMDNFKTPYLSKNIAEFWQRWHISLSTWFRDYVYLPMGGSKVDKGKWMINIMTVFLVSGFWHGASWNFIIWGGIFGIFYLIEKRFSNHSRPKKEVRKFGLKHIVLLIKTNLIVMIAWVFFRSQSLEETLSFFQSIFHSDHELKLQVPWLIWAFLLVFILSDWILYDSRFDQKIKKAPLVLRWSIYTFLIASIIMFAGVESFPFIYFQF